MAKLKEYFATEKLTPDDTGVTAWETAARRINTASEQEASLTKERANAVGRYWDEQKVFYDQQNQGRGGGGGGFKVSGGGGRTLIGTGSAEGRTPYTDPQAGNPGAYAKGNQFNAGAHREISRAAPQLFGALGDLLQPGETQIDTRTGLPIQYKAKDFKEYNAEQARMAYDWTKKNATGNMPPVEAFDSNYVPTYPPSSDVGDIMGRAGLATVNEDGGPIDPDLLRNLQNPAQGAAGYDQSANTGGEAVQSTWGSIVDTVRNAFSPSDTSSPGDGGDAPAPDDQPSSLD